MKRAFDYGSEIAFHRESRFLPRIMEFELTRSDSFRTVKFPRKSVPEVVYTSSSCAISEFIYSYWWICGSQSYFYYSCLIWRWTEYSFLYTSWRIWMWMRRKPNTIDCYQYSCFLQHEHSSSLLSKTLAERSRQTKRKIANNTSFWFSLSWSLFVAWWNSWTKSTRRWW